MKKVSIITVNYNGEKVTCEMIDSIRKYNSFPIEIIVVDNASRANDADILEQKYPDIKIVRSSKNLGFAGGNNLGIDVASGDFILLLNNDTTIKSDFLLPLVHRIESEPYIGVVCPKIKFESEPDRIQFAGFTPMSRITLRNSVIGYGETDCPSNNIPLKTPFAHGAAMLIKKEVIEKIGKMPENYFLYYEEMDWAEQINHAGYEIWYEPSSEVYHKESYSTGTDSPLKVYYMTRNRFLFAKRNRKGKEKTLSVLYLASVVSIRDLFKRSVKGEFKQLASCIRGIKDGLFIKPYD